MNLSFLETSAVESQQKHFWIEHIGAFVDETKQRCPRRVCVNDPCFLSLSRSAPRSSFSWSEATVEEGSSSPVAANRSRHTDSNQQHLPGSIVLARERCQTNQQEATTAACRTTLGSTPAPTQPLARPFAPSMLFLPCPCSEPGGAPMRWTPTTSAVVCNPAWLAAARCWHALPLVDEKMPSWRNRRREPQRGQYRRQRQRQRSVTLVPPGQCVNRKDLRGLARDKGRTPVWRQYQH